MLRTLTLLLVCFASCATPVARKTAAELANHVEALNGHMTDYQNALERDAKRRIDRIASQRSTVAYFEDDLQQTLAIWRLLKLDRAQSLHAGVLAAIDASVDATLDLETKLQSETQALKKLQTAYESQQRTLASLAEQLRAMAEDPDLKTTAKFLVAFGQEAYDRMKELEKEGAEESKP